MALRRALVVALVLAVTGVGAQSAAAKPAFHPRVGNALGLVPGVGRQGDFAAGSPVPVVFHGGNVMRSGVAVHLIFWGPPGFSFHSGYRTLIQQFFTDAAAASGLTSNVFSVLPQFGDNGGAGDYALSVDSITDTQAFPTTDNCASANGAPTCLTDHQVQAEVDRVIQASGGTLHRGLGDLYMVYLPQDVDTCILPGACASNAFGGYHSLSNLGHGTTIYANLPDPGIEGTLPANDTFPEGNSDAEFQIDVSAHETVEAMTDPEGTGWMDPNGFEVADKCEFGPMHGPALGQATNGADFNQVINGHDYLLQEMWSNDDGSGGGCVQRTSQTASPLPLPQVNLTQFGTSVSGNIGAATAGVQVTVHLLRTGVEVASGSGTTNSSGAWTASLGSQAVGDDRDEIDIDYTGTGAPLDQTILTGNGGQPDAEAGWTGWGDLDTGFFIPDSTEIDLFPCFQVGVLNLSVGASSPTVGVCDTETDQSATPTSIAPANAITMSTNDNRAFSLDNPNGALVKLTVPLGEAGATSPDFTTGGFPVCTGDLEAGTVSCSGLVPGDHYTLTRSRGGLAVGANADDSGIATAGFSGSPALAGGDSVAVRNGAGRLLTTLHVAHLRVDLTGNQSVVSAGQCEPGKYYGPFTIAPTQSSFVGAPDGPAGTGTICPLDGDASGLDATGIAQTDDQSGGQTQTEVPDVEDTSPMQAETLYGGFTALADAGLPGPANSVVPVSDAVSLSITPAAGGAPVFNAANVNSAAGVAVPALPPGTYAAHWVLTDKNGDTRTITTRFVEQAALQGAQGPPGPPGAPGPRGPRGPRGHSAKVTCKVKGRHIRCTVKVKKSTHASVRAMLSRGSRIAAIGHGRIRHGRATLTLRTIGRVRRGRARITLVIATSRRSARTITQTVRVR